MTKPDRTVHVLLGSRSAQESLATLQRAGIDAVGHADAGAARALLRTTRDSGVWLVHMDAIGEELMEWAREATPHARFVAVAERLSGNTVHHAYRLGAEYCASTHEADLVRGVEFVMDGPDVARRSIRRLRVCASPSLRSVPKTISTTVSA